MANHSTSTVTLSSSFHMPVIGLGTSFSTTSDAPDPIEVENTVKIALQLGYRHIDCAPVYQNEVAVGQGIKASGVPRKDLFITSKLWNTEHDPKDVESAVDQTLRDLGTDYVDLYLVHWPQSYVKMTPYTLFPEDENGNPMTVDIPIAATWQAMEALVAAGKARSIGVSNFFQPQIEELLLTAKIHPAVNQIPATPYRPKTDRVEWCRSKNIHVTAWGPLTIDRATQYNVAADPAAQKIASSINITPAQLVLNWSIQRGTSVIPKSSHEERLRSNLAVVELSPEIMAQVDQLEILV
ncbi:NADP-dependent oxidoreductase domain-containing protein [Leptodontidium sp. 2 PMI_412]|nr:NADP-dependent oxidoreductase domain-containing protein [Leptodontidium sp. 2 PMI_412]